MTGCFLIVLFIAKAKSPFEFSTRFFLINLRRFQCRTTRASTSTIRWRSSSRSSKLKGRFVRLWPAPATTLTSWLNTCCCWPRWVWSRLANVWPISLTRFVPRQLFCSCARTIDLTCFMVFPDVLLREHAYVDHRHSRSGGVLQLDTLYSWLGSKELPLCEQRVCRGLLEGLANRGPRHENG